MNNAIIHKLSPVLIYQTEINYQSDIKKIYFEKMDEYGFDSNIPEFIFPLGMIHLQTGEVRSKGFLHKDKSFNLFFSELKKHVNEFVSQIGFDVNLFSFHVTKSWYTILNQNMEVSMHRHSAGDLSFVYYIDVPPDSGDICFFNPNYIDYNLNNYFMGMFRPPYPGKKFIKTDNPHTEEFYNIKSESGNLVIFPSHLHHKVSRSMSKQNRYSLSGDIKICLDKNIDNYEHGLIHPSYWTEL